MCLGSTQQCIYHLSQQVHPYNYILLVTHMHTQTLIFFSVWKQHILYLLTKPVRALDETVFIMESVC